MRQDGSAARTSPRPTSDTFLSLAVTGGQPTDAMATCPMIVAEIEANNVKVREVAGEEGTPTPIRPAACPPLLGLRGQMLNASSPIIPIAITSTANATGS
jgi:hypothetical protein